VTQETLANGRYVIQRRLATGGMGEVLLAEYAGDDEVSPGLLVVKRILSAAPGLAPNEGQVRMLLEEGRLGLRLLHENLVETFRTEADGDSPLLVIELLAGRSMAQVLGQAKKRRENVPVDVALAILRGACCGLHFAHTLKGPDGRGLGLVHRDVSPANIFVTFDGKVKVIDFGVAKSEDSEVKTATGILKGKLGYMSPEQSIGETKLTPQADVWSLGVFFWETLLAERLFSSPNPTATLLQITQKEIPAPRTMRADIPPAVEALALKMLKRGLDERFKTCADVVRAIDAVPGINARAVDVGAFVAGRFPDEAVAGAAEAARCARRRGRVLVAKDIAEGTVGVDPAEDDELATTILPTAVREQLLASARAPLPATVPVTTLPKPPPPTTNTLADDGEDAATVRVTADVVAQVRAGSGAMPRAPAVARPGFVDEDEIATSRVTPEMARAAREPFAPTVPSAPPPSPPSPAPSSPTSSLTSSFTRRPGLTTVPPTAPVSSPVESAPAPPTPARPAAISATVRAVAPPASVPEPTSWPGLAAATFGALALLMGVVFAFTRPTPTPSFVVFQDPATSQSVVVADATHVPVGRDFRPLDLDQARLHRPGDLEGRLVPRAELEDRLKLTGVWQRGSLPTTSKAKTAALLPIVVAAIGALALAISLPLILVSRRRRLPIQVVAGLLTVGLVAAALQFGALSWPGYAAFHDAPRLVWD
jgi:serine/threonine protein kinase